jgi:REP element-mobilizing transposase RayT
MGMRNRTVISDPSAFFVTTSTLDRRSVFVNGAARIAQNTLLEVCETKKVRLLSYVIMSSHLHLIVWLNGGGPELSGLMSSLKGLIRYRTVDN